MIRSLRSALGATLLEVMLVLSIAALIILMSVRYYQAATASGQVEQAMNVIQAITASADNLAVGASTGYKSTVTTSNISALAGSSALTTSWNGTVKISGPSQTTYTVSISNVPTGVCTALVVKLKTQPKFTSPACDSSGKLSYTYDSTK